MNKSIKIILVLVGLILAFVLFYPVFIRDELGVNIEATPDSINGKMYAENNENILLLQDSLYLDSLYIDNFKLNTVDSIIIVQKIDSFVNEYYIYADSILKKSANLNKDIYLNYIKFIDKFNLVVDSISSNIGVKTNRQKLFDIYKFKIDSIFSVDIFFKENSIKKHNIIIGSFSNEKNAINFIKNINSKYNPIIIQHDNLYLVSVLGIDSLNNANELNTWLKNNTIYKNSWIFTLN